MNREVVRTGVVGKDDVRSDEVGVYRPLLRVGGKISLNNVRLQPKIKWEPTHEENVDEECTVNDIFLHKEDQRQNLGTMA